MSVKSKKQQKQDIESFILAMFFAAVLLMRARELFLLMIPLSRRPTSPLPTSPSPPPSSRLGIFNASLRGDIFSISLHNEQYHQMIPCQAGYFLIDLNILMMMSEKYKTLHKQSILRCQSPNPTGVGGGDGGGWLFLMLFHIRWLEWAVRIDRCKLWATITQIYEGALLLSPTIKANSVWVHCVFLIYKLTSYWWTSGLIVVMWWAEWKGEGESIVVQQVADKWRPLKT